jgi:PTH1 family peptidyl-tRNA hydrolase
MKLIAGLGNPGSQYEITRHNIGFMAVDLVAESLNIDFKKQSHFSLMGEGWVEDEKILLMKPLTYMNNSGKAVASAINFYKLPLADVLIIHDDMDLQTGRLRVRRQGSSGGHKGMESIIQLTGSQEIPRMKIGIGKPLYQAVVDYVLMPFSAEDRPTIKAALHRADQAVQLWIKEGITAVMNKYNSMKAGTDFS